MPPLTNQNNSNAYRHTHNGVDSEQINASDLQNCPQPALTAASGGSLSSGGLSALQTADATIIANTIARVNEIETRLRAIGLIL